MRKYLIFCLFTLISGIILFTGINVHASLSLVGKIIVVDIGHGGKDPGTMVNDIYEKDLNLQISKKLQKELIKNGATVLMVREGDYDLSKPNALWRKKSDFDNRINLINNSQADMYISIHINYLTNKNYKGAQIFYDDVNKNNEKIAKIMQKTLNNELQNNRDYKKINNSVYMYNKLEVQGVLIECGFLSNAEEKILLTKPYYQQKIAKSIVQGVLNYFNS